MKKLHYLFFSATLLIGSAANAQLQIEIAGVGSNQIPVAVAAFADESMAPSQISAVIRADLERSGVFKVIDAGQVISDSASIDPSAWKGRGADALVVGSVQRQPDGRLAVRYKLYDTVKGSQLSQLGGEVQPKYTRLQAHRIADDVYEKLTGVRGIFSTRIAYVKENRAGRNYALAVADADGENEIVAVHGKEPIISPSWSPDGGRVAYVSFEDRKPVIYMQDLVTGKRRVIANEKGSNSAPSWSPDGSKLAIALSKSGSYQVYIVNADGSGLRRLSNSNGIDTEPQFSADGQSIYFTSDRSGGPQIYKMSVSGGNATRVTFNGNYNISPRVSPDGKTLAWISQQGGGYSLYAKDLASGQELRLADGATEPSFSPNGKYIMYANKGGGRASLAVVSTDGRVKQRLTTNAGNIREPSWGPFMK
ncbi:MULTISPECIES: Tol-Pal system beta propeller repeat protein TolB [unclassified Massilia]|uniref:Tol-Pal system beta propeller repeat protein TolB n=1 Tax=unclassified Massilia TaxID=2609279 RepID=UPI0017831B79|nr:MULTISPECIES: Tol-Pal system beta propeller repeat protein TolB [unclassified Massilia]MBD8532276.1 Tol-Pal system protein TolB [Massilia sp. CFBP 13647]MBD8675649.1 Tol-Pal system protein TolB [Massilia sp. CFBP 13721]